MQILYHGLACSYKHYLLEGSGNMDPHRTSDRVAWSLAEISEQTGLSIGYLRNELRGGRLPVKRFGRRILVLEQDLREYLSRGSTRAEIFETAA